jgi:hypothetical protein
MDNYIRVCRNIYVFMITHINIMELDPKIWGPHYWFVLHTIALNYPLRPNAVIKKKYYDFIQNVPSLLPHKLSRDNMTTLLSAYPISSYLDSRKSFIQWTHFIHNKLNEMIERPQIPLSEFYTRYYAEYKPKPLKQYEFIYWRKKLVYSCILIILIAVIYYLSVV